MLSSADTETWIRRKYGDKKGFFFLVGKKSDHSASDGDRAICWARFSRVTFMQYTAILQFFQFIQSETTTDLLTSRLTTPLKPEFRVSYLALLYVHNNNNNNMFIYCNWIFTRWQWLIYMFRRSRIRISLRKLVIKTQVFLKSSLIHS